MIEYDIRLNFDAITKNAVRRADGMQPGSMTIIFENGESIKAMFMNYDVIPVGTVVYVMENGFTRARLERMADCLRTSKVKEIKEFKFYYDEEGTLEIDRIENMSFTILFDGTKATYSVPSDIPMEIICKKILGA